MKRAKRVQESDLIEALELMAAHFKWQIVNLQVCRKPEGECRFWASVDAEIDKGLPSYYEFGETPMDAAQNVILKCPNPTPEAIKEKTIRDMEEQLAKLKAVIFPLPPYKPGTRLAEHASQTVDV